MSGGARLLWAALLALALIPARGEVIRVAVASNFQAPAKVIAERFEAQSGHQVKLTVGATGKHYAQIVNGAPFAAFLAADRHRPQRLEEAGTALPGSRFTYALGRLALWSPRADMVDTRGEVLARGGFTRLAIANPRLAPYGQAAREVLEARGLWQSLAPRMVRGGNIGQTFQFIDSGNAELGFVAYSQIRPPHAPAEGSHWEVPAALHSPIAQQAVLLRDTPAARGFLDYLRGEQAARIIRDHGYRLPGGE
ncbi:MAG: molybdate ABC transporter substrate-binding protein [Candidatus Sedimenticola endophacoides]